MLHSTKNEITILIIDDGPLNIRMLEGVLVKEGYRILSATNGPDGRKLAITEKPNLIILDVMMPGENGFEVMKKLKSQPASTDIPVIFLTGKEDFSSKINGFNLGAVDYMIKPCHPLEVKARVRLHIKLSIAKDAIVANQAEKLKQIKDAQSSMLISPSDIPDARFGVYYSALLEAGGDFYDVLRISEHIFGYFVADVSGHDIGTSFITPSVKALLQQNCTPIFSPVESIQMINSVLIELIPVGKYLTACYIKLNRKTKMISLVNAGHPPVILIKKDGSIEAIEIAGDVLGAFDDACYEQVDIPVESGDRLFAYSDGLIENIGEKCVWTEGVGKLIDVCKKIEGMPVDVATKELSKLMNADSAQQTDDVVVLGIEV